MLIISAKSSDTVELFNKYIGSLSLLNNDDHLKHNKKSIISWAHEMIESK